MKDISEVKFYYYSNFNSICTGSINYIEWYKDGARHRAKRPALYQYHATFPNVLYSATWAKNGWYESDYTPIIAKYSPITGEILDTKWSKNNLIDKYEYTNDVHSWLKEKNIDVNITEIPDEYKAEFKLRFL